MVFAIAWGMGVALAALAAIMYGMAPFPPGGNISQEIHPLLAFRVLPVIVLGGLDSAIGAVYAGFLIAGAEVFAGAVPFVIQQCPRLRGTRRSCRTS